MSWLTSRRNWQNIVPFASSRPVSRRTRSACVPCEKFSSHLFSWNLERARRKPCRTLQARGGSSLKNVNIAELCDKNTAYKRTCAVCADVHFEILRISRRIWKSNCLMWLDHGTKGYYVWLRWLAAKFQMAFCWKKVVLDSSSSVNTHSASQGRSQVVIKLSAHTIGSAGPLLGGKFLDLDSQMPSPALSGVFKECFSFIFYSYCEICYKVGTHPCTRSMDAILIVKYTMYQRKVDVDMLNAVKCVGWALALRQSRELFALTKG